MEGFFRFERIFSFIIDEEKQTIEPSFTGLDCMDELKDYKDNPYLYMYKLNIKETINCLRNVFAHLVLERQAKDFFSYIRKISKLFYELNIDNRQEFKDLIKDLKKQGINQDYFAIAGVETTLYLVQLNRNFTKITEPEPISSNCLYKLRKIGDQRKIVRLSTCRRKLDYKKEVYISLCRLYETKEITSDTLLECINKINEVE